MATVWTEWSALTRFLKSARVAFTSERNLWHSLELADRQTVTITTQTGTGHYAVSIEVRIAAVDDEVTLFASVLVHTYALAEDAPCRKVGLDSRTVGGNEVWGKWSLDANDRDWTGVLDSESGAVE